MICIQEPSNAHLDELWRTYSTDLLRFATVLVGPNEAQDITVEAFLGAASSASSDAVVNPRSYLMRAVANRAADLRRSGHRRWRRDLAAVSPSAAGGHESYAEVRAAVSSLSLAQRTVIYFVYWEDRTESDIAAILQISPGTVRRHLVRARDHLRKALK
jgi:RNA polymerase sigma-70 factor (ECF subfamily)